LYLIDTNIWLERLLNQEKSEEVRRFLDSVPSENLYITDFTLHSIGVILHRLKKLNVLIKFVQDIFINGKVNLVHLGAIDMLRVVDVMKDFNLDFDDAYQYVAAEKYDLIIISFDKDFDRTKKGRKLPSDIF
jgi:predicted nucleic acid-binding protein